MAWLLFAFAMLVRPLVAAPAGDVPAEIAGTGFPAEDADGVVERVRMNAATGDLMSGFYDGVAFLGGLGICLAVAVAVLPLLLTSRSACSGGLLRPARQSGLVTR